MHSNHSPSNVLLILILISDYIFYLKCREYTSNIFYIGNHIYIICSFLYVTEIIGTSIYAQRVCQNDTLYNVMLNGQVMNHYVRGTIGIVSADKNCRVKGT